MRKTANKPGRPRKPTEEKRSERLNLKLTPVEFALLRERAPAEGLYVWARDVLLRAAKRR